MSAMVRRLRGDERGTAVIETVGIVPYLILAALASWQMLLVAATVTAVENAARTGGRVAAAGGDGEQAALDALPGFAWSQEPDSSNCPPEAAASAPAAVAAGGGEAAGGGLAKPDAEPGPNGQEGTCRRIGATVRGDQVTVTVGAPLLVPGLTTDAVTISRSASFPALGARHGQDGHGRGGVG